MSRSDKEMHPEHPKDLAYDPDQDPEEKRKVRREYRSLHKDTEGKQANPNEYTAEELVVKVHRADSLFDKVKGPQEATLDSAFLVMASTMGAQKARAMKSGGSGFDIDEFISKLITFMGGRRPMEDQLQEGSDIEDTDYGDSPLDWERIGRKALAKSRRVPVPDFMLGPLAIEQKKRTTGQRAKLEKNKDEETRPQELNEADIARSQNETTKNVAILEKLLVDCGRINLFKFVVNPHDFAQSVENIFYLSFLIRDGKVALETDGNGEPMIYTCQPPSDVDYEQGLKKRQIVMEFDMATWRRAIEVFGITKPQIPQRAARSSAGG